MTAPEYVMVPPTDLSVKDGRRVPADVAARQLMGMYYELSGNHDMAADVRSDDWEHGTGSGPRSERQLLAIMAALVEAVRREDQTMLAAAPYAPTREDGDDLVERLRGPVQWGYMCLADGGFIADDAPVEAADRLAVLPPRTPSKHDPDCGLLYEDGPDQCTCAALPPRTREDGEPIAFTYTNWRGETATRRAIPRGLRWGSTEWHPAPGWLMLAFDVEKQADREFALADCVFARRTPSREEIARDD